MIWTHRLRKPQKGGLKGWDGWANTPGGHSWPGQYLSIYLLPAFFSAVIDSA